MSEHSASLSIDDFVLLGSFGKYDVRYSVRSDDLEPLLLIDAYYYRLSSWWKWREATVDALGLGDWWDEHNLKLLDQLKLDGVIGASQVEQIKATSVLDGELNRSELAMSALHQLPISPGIIHTGSIQRISEALLHR